MKDVRNLTAPCGIDCFNCELFEDNITEELIQMISKSMNVPEALVICKGCRAQKGKIMDAFACETWDCVSEKGHEFCFECNEFPCGRFLTCADGASRFPHNYKMYNLCRIKLLGFDKWVDEAESNREKYFKGKLIPGTGPVLEEE